MIITAIDGLCMAIADSVPGVSGGTVAFILGFYDRFINALHDLFGAEREARKTAARYLLRLFVGWGPGMCLCVLLLSGLFADNIYLMSSLFLGLTIASIPFVAYSERKSLRGRTGDIPFFFLGAAAVIGLSLLRSGFGLLGGISFLTLRPLHLLYIFCAGMVAIAAMVLPGISGSTVLLIAGVYLPAVEAIKQLMHLQFAVLPGLAALGIGILSGVGLSIHFIRSALKKHRGAMVYLIIGLMLGSLFAIVMGPTTLTQPLPALSLSTFSLPGFSLGIAALLALELLKNVTARKKQAGSAAEIEADAPEQ